MSNPMVSIREQFKVSRALDETAKRQAGVERQRGEKINRLNNKSLKSVKRVSC